MDGDVYLAVEEGAFDGFGEQALSPNFRQRTIGFGVAARAKDRFVDHQRRIRLAEPRYDDPRLGSSEHATSCTNAQRCHSTPSLTTGEFNRAPQIRKVRLFGGHPRL